MIRGTRDFGKVNFRFRQLKGYRWGEISLMGFVVSRSLASYPRTNTVMCESYVLILHSLFLWDMFGRLQETLGSEWV